MEQVEVHSNLYDLKTVIPGTYRSLKDASPDQYRWFAGKSHAEQELFDNNTAFVSSELMRSHEISPYNPLHNVTYPLDINGILTGGGWSKILEYKVIDYAGLQEQTENLVGSSVNVVPRINAHLKQVTTPVFTYQIAYDQSYVELKDLELLNFRRSFQQIYQDAIRVGFDFFTQKIAYFGVTQSGVPGLFNNPNIVPNINNPHFDTLDEAEILAWFNGVFAFSLTVSGWNLSVMPDHFAMPPRETQELSARISPLFTHNLRNFILANNYGTDESQAEENTPFKMRIVSRVQLADLGIAGEGRAVVYRNNILFVRLDIPFSPQILFSGPNAERVSQTFVYAAQVTGIQMPYVDSNPGNFGGVSYYDFFTAII